MGRLVGIPDGDCEGLFVGVLDGEEFGSTDRIVVGSSVGSSVGTKGEFCDK